MCDSIPIKFTLVGDEDKYYDNYKRIIGIIKGVLADGRTLNEMVKAEIDALNEIIDGETYEIGIFAPKITGPSSPTPNPPANPNFRSCEDDGWIFERPAGGNNSQALLPPMNNLATTNRYLKVSPNPAKDIVYFTYDVPDKNGALSVLIVNSIGQVVKQFKLNDKKVF